MPYDRVRAEEVVDFYRRYLVYVDGPLVGQPIELRDWQADPLRKIFGTVNDQQLREILTVFWLMNKKQGKTEIIAAGLALFMMTFGAEHGARIFAAANSRDQAAEIFKPAAEMIKLSEPLQALGFDPNCDIIDSTKTIVYRPRNAVFKAVAAEAGTLHGKKPSFLICDEIHAMKDRLMIDALREGMGTWKEPLTLYISNMGEIGGSQVLWEEKEYAEKVRKDPAFDRTYFPIIYEAPAEMTDAQLLEEGPHWKALNPGLGDFMALSDMRRACREAKEKPQQRANVLRFRLGRATQPITAWMPIENWRACAEEFSEEDLWGRSCFAGLDLSSKWDLSALALVFPESDGGATIHGYAYVPQENIEAIAKITGKPIRRWIEQGYILATPGNRIDLDFIENHIKTLKQRFEILQLAYDPAFAEQITQHIEKFGIQRIEFPQTAAHFNEPCHEFERQVSARKIRHNGNPVMDFCIESMAVKTDDREQIRPVKIKERGRDSRRIDLAVAALMAFSRRIRQVATEAGFSFA